MHENTPVVSAALRRKGMLRRATMVMLVVLSGCAARPGPETLQPVLLPSGGGEPVTLLAVTDRAALATDPPVPGSGRGSTSFEQFWFQPRPGVEIDPDKPVSDASTQFVTTGRRLMSEAAFDAEVGRMAASRDQTITVFVHGYNYSYQEAVFRLAQLTSETGEASVPVLFSWPSNARPAGYLADRDGAAYARDDLVRLLIQLRRDHPERRIGVIGHSLGGWLVMEALRQMRLQGDGDMVDGLRVVLASPDIDMDVFRSQARTVGPLRTPLAVLVSSGDRALAVSGGLSGGRQRVGDASPNSPELLAIAKQGGMRVIDITSVPATDGLNHDRYIGFAARYAAMAQHSQPGGDIRRAGVYVLDTTGRILSSPFNAASRVLAGQ